MEKLTAPIQVQEARTWGHRNQNGIKKSVKKKKIEERSAKKSIDKVRW